MYHTVCHVCWCEGCLTVGPIKRILEERTKMKMKMKKREEILRILPITVVVYSFHDSTFLASDTLLWILLLKIKSSHTHTHQHCCPITLSNACTHNSYTHQVIWLNWAYDRMIKFNTNSAPIWASATWREKKKFIIDEKQRAWEIDSRWVLLTTAFGWI